MTPREQELTRQLEQCLEALDESRRENALLRQKIDLLVKRVFGSSGEQLDRNQLELLMQLPVTATVQGIVAAPEKERSRKEPVAVRKERLPENLPVVEEVIDPEPVKAQPEQWRCIGQEVSEQLDYEPGRFLRRRVVRRKYVHRTNPDFAPIMAALPERLLDRSLPAPGLLAHIVVGKYCDHLPLYRQEQIYQQRHGVHLPRQSLTRWVELASEWLKPIYEQIRTGVMGGGYVQVDETPVDYLEPGHGKTKQGYLWTCSRPGGDVFYRWETSRAAECLDNIIPVDFNGTIQCDGYAAYRSFANGRSGTIKPAGCYTCGESFMRPWSSHLKLRAGSCAKSNAFTAWKPGCVNKGPGRNYAPQFAPMKADPSWNDWNAPSSASRAAVGSCRRACWASPLIMRWASGRRWTFIWATVEWRSTTIWWKTPSAPRLWARRTGSLHG